MRHLLVITAAALALAACDAGPGSASQANASAGVSSINTVPPRPAPLQGPPMLSDEAPPPKPKVMPWETPKPIVFSPEDEKLRASLPFSPAIAMDPIDGSKISMLSTTPTFEYKGKIYYFQNEANRKIFMSNPEQALKGGFMKL